MRTRLFCLPFFADPGHPRGVDLAATPYVGAAAQAIGRPLGCGAQTFSNGGVTLGGRSIHSGTGRFFERRNFGLNSFDW